MNTNFKKFKEKLGKTVFLSVMIFSLTIVICVGIILSTFTGEAETRLDGIEDSPDKKLRPISVKRIVQSEQKAEISGLGEVLPEWQTTISTEVGGKITWISDKLKPGTQVKKGEKLIVLDSSAYLVRVAEAEYRVSVEQVNLLAEEREAREAKANWKRSGLSGQPDSGLVLRVPQLEVAKKALLTAQCDLERAKKELAFTIIKAPYNGLIVMRYKDLGETLFPGDQVAEMYSTDKAEIAVRLDERQWELLPRRWQNKTATVIDPSNKKSWNAIIRRDSGFLERETRLRILYLEVEKPYAQSPPLLPGTFVRVVLPGQSFSNVLSVPESAITQKGMLWYVDKENTLGTLKAKTIFYRGGNVFLNAPAIMEEALDVVLAPTLNMISGTRIKPVYINLNTHTEERS